MLTSAPLLSSAILGGLAYVCGYMFVVLSGGLAGRGGLVQGAHEMVIKFALLVFVVSLTFGLTISRLLAGRSWSAILGGIIGILAVPKVVHGPLGLSVLVLVPALIVLFDKYNKQLPDSDLQPIVSLVEGIVIGGLVNQF